MYSVNEETRVFKTSPYLEEEGLINGFQIDKGRLVLKKEDGIGYFFLRGYDALTEEMTWNRLVLRDNSTYKVKTELYLLAKDDPEIETVLQGNNLNCKQKIEYMISQGAKHYVNMQDLFLHDLCGRYIFVALQAYNVEGEDYVLEEMAIEYPKKTFLDYFPQIYSENNDFFERYVGIFQSLYLDIEKRISEMSALLDVDTTPDYFLNYLGSWVGIDNSEEIFSPSQMRQVLRKAMRINAGKGTKATLEQLIMLYTGAKPIIIEQFRWQKNVFSKTQKQLYGKLYGKEANCFAIMLIKDQITQEVKWDKLRRLINKYIPITTSYKLIILDQCYHTDQHCYLEVNSYLARPTESKLDDKMHLGNNTLIRLQ